jgi:hypothetical protein
MENKKTMLHEDEVNLIVDVWTSVKTYIDKKERYDAASAFLRSLENHYDMDSVSEELLGNDNVLDTVIADIYGTSDFDEDEGYEEDNYDSDYDDE